MSDNVHKLSLVSVGEGFRFVADDILGAAKGKDFTQIAILAQHEDGSIWVSGSANLGETLVLMELAKHELLFGGDQ